jgi:hypothetical protein
MPPVDLTVNEILWFSNLLHDERSQLVKELDRRHPPGSIQAIHEQIAKIDDLIKRLKAHVPEGGFHV